MAAKESKEISKIEPEKSISSFWDMDKWFEDFFKKSFPIWSHQSMKGRGMETVVPSVDLFEENNDVVVKAELPGMSKEDIEVTLTDDTITLSGEKKKEEKLEKKNYYRWECSCGSFSRTFTLPAEVQKDKIKSKLKDGVLEIRLPKTEEARKKEIKIKVE
jgi:HSP20 family protein